MPSSNSLPAITSSNAFPSPNTATQLTHDHTLPSSDSDTSAQTPLPLNAIDAFIERLTLRRYVKVHTRFDTPWFNHLVNDPDQLINAPWSKLLKHDTSTTVALTSFDGQQVVIKRYNPRNPLYVIKRIFRVSRAKHCLRASVLFTKAGIGVAPHVGMIEKRVGPLRCTSYYLMLYTHGELLTDWFSETHTLREQDQPVLHAIKDTFDKLAEHRLYHGDMKASNLIWQHGKLVLLDLDAARQCNDPQRLATRLTADKARFLKNFAQRPALQSAIKRQLLW